jgi:hypothetical protein
MMFVIVQPVFGGSAMIAMNNNFDVECAQFMQA